MKTSNKARALAAVVAASALAGTFLSGGGAVKADPKQYDSQIIGVGSDTTESIMNAMSGFENGVFYTPVHGVSNNKVITSWDATAAGLTTTCIVTKTGGPAFNRPFGSGAGRGMLVASLSATGTQANTNCGTTSVAASGSLSFARSSSVSTTAGTTLAYVPFALDALSYTAYKNGGTPVTDLTEAELKAAYTTAAGTVGFPVTRAGVTTTIYACGINPSSGTGTTWLGKIGTTAAAANTTACDNLINPATTVAFGPAEENNSQNLVDRGNAAPAGVEVIIGMSIGNFIGKFNGVSAGQAGTNLVTVGTINAIGAPTTANNAAFSGIAPLTITAGVAAPNPLWFDATNSYTRFLYNVIPAAVINSANPASNPDIKEIFKGNPIGSATVPVNSNPNSVCAFMASANGAKFGFQPIGVLCGDTTTTLRAG